MPSYFQRAAVWSGVVCVVVFFLGFIFSGFVPPPSPSWSVEEVVAHYRSHTTGIRVGMCFMLLSGAFYAVFTAAISGQMRRIPNVCPTTVYAQLAAGSFASLTFMMPAIFFLVTAFRPERSPELTFTLNDLSFIMLVIPWPPFMAQNFALASAILSDTSERPLFPRWFGYLNIWTPITFTPGIMLPFFKSGPFAWNGVLTLWIPAVVFIVWFFVASHRLHVASSRSDGDLATGASPHRSRRGGFGQVGA